MTQETKNESQIEYNFLVYEYHTWGTHGQHTKTITYLVTDSDTWTICSEY